MPKDLDEKCKKVYLEKLEEEKEKEKNTKSSVKSVTFFSKCPLLHFRLYNRKVISTSLLQTNV